jgi:hypothetical protein
MSAKNQYRFLREIEATEEALKPLTTKYITVPKNEDSQDSKNGVSIFEFDYIETGVLPLQKCEGADTVHCGEAIPVPGLQHHSQERPEVLF